MIHSTKDAGPELRFELYKNAMKRLYVLKGRQGTEGGWILIRALGKQILKKDQASDSECAEAVILKYPERP